MLAEAIASPVHRHRDEGARELPVPPSVSGAEDRWLATAATPRRVRRTRQRGGRADPPADHRRLGRATDTGDRAELKDLPEDLPLWSEIAASAENCLGRECPQLRRLLRHAHAPARRRIRSRHRQSPPAVRGCRRAAGRVRRGHPRLRRRGPGRSAPARGRRDAILRRRPSATIAPRISRATPSACWRAGRPDGAEPALAGSWTVARSTRLCAERLFARLAPPRRGAADETRRASRPRR